MINDWERQACNLEVRIRTRDAVERINEKLAIAGDWKQRGQQNGETEEVRDWANYIEGLKKAKSEIMQLAK